MDDRPTKPNFGPAYQLRLQTTEDQGYLGAVEMFDRSVASLVDERRDDYGHPYVNFGRIAHLEAVVDDCPDPRLRHVLRQIAVKMARLVNSPGHLDSWNDIAGYARTACMVIDAQATTEEKHHAYETEEDQSEEAEEDALGEDGG